MYSLCTRSTYVGMYVVNCRKGIIKTLFSFSAVVDCGTLAAPQNGKVTLTTATFMSTANYSCNSGYTLSGNETRTCEATGTWSGITPTCDRKYKMLQGTSQSCNSNKIKKYNKQLLSHRTKC